MKACAGARRGEAQRVADRPRPHLAVARKPGKDRQAGGVGRCPALRAQPVRAEVPHRAGARPPARAAVLRIGGEELVQAAAGAVHHDHVTVPVRAATALDGRVRGHRVGPAVRLVRVVEAHRHAVLAGRARSRRGCRSGPPSHRPEPKSACMWASEADAPHDLRGARLDGQAVHPRVPLAVRREHRAGAQLGRASPARARARGSGQGERGQHDQRPQECTAPHRLEGRPAHGPIRPARRMY